VGREIVEQHFEVLFRPRVVVFPPGKRIGLSVANDEFILRAAIGVNAGISYKRTVLGDLRVAALKACS
jgi:hypothetical protein